MREIVSFIAASKCFKMVMLVVFALALLAISCDAQLKEDRAGYVYCPDGNYCYSGQTCCYTFSGSYGCCPYSNAVCCYDGDNCCPNGYYCSYDTCYSVDADDGGVGIKKEKNPVAVLKLLKAIGFREGEREEGSRRGKAQRVA